jgi:hypothetical protein
MPKGEFAKRLRPWLVAVMAGAAIVIVMSPSGRADVEGSCVHGYDADGNIVPCADAEPDSGYYDDGGSGGAGCATSEDYAYEQAPAPPPAGSPNPDHDNVVMGSDGHWYPAPGYEWASGDESDLRVVPLIGATHPDHPNIVMTETGWLPEPGYRWATDNHADLSVVRAVGAAHPDHPNIVMSESGWVPLPGYRWASDDTSRLDVVRNIGAQHPDYPHITMTETGWMPEVGYRWASDNTNRLEVVRDIGATHPDHPHVVMTDSGWAPASGYRWATADPGNLATEPVVPPPPTPTASSLRIIDVPSPTGFKSASERLEQVSRLSDEQIDATIKSVDKLLRRMQKDFANDTGSIEGWLAEAQSAEYDAVMASFKLLIEGSLSRFAKGWDQFPRLKALAENGMRYLEFEEPVNGLIADPEGYDSNMAMARSCMLELYKALYGFDPDLITENGPPAAQLADFTVSYSYQVARWALAYESIRLITENLDRPDGKLKAQQSIQRLYEDLIQERNRRRAT